MKLFCSAISTFHLTSVCSPNDMKDSKPEPFVDARELRFLNSHSTSRFQARNFCGLRSKEELWNETITIVIKREHANSALLDVFKFEEGNCLSMSTNMFPYKITLSFLLWKRKSKCSLLDVIEWWRQVTKVSSFVRFLTSHAHFSVVT